MSRKEIKLNMRTLNKKTKGSHKAPSTHSRESNRIAIKKNTLYIFVILNILAFLFTAGISASVFSSYDRLYSRYSILEGQLKQSQNIVKEQEKELNAWHEMDQRNDWLPVAEYLDCWVYQNRLNVSFDGQETGKAYCLTVPTEDFDF